MGVNFKNYELSLWLDRLQTRTSATSGTSNNNPPAIEETYFAEKRRAIIGSNTMIAQNRARNVKLVENINGTTTLTFVLYTRYQDHVTGEQVENPFCYYVKNEAKLKLKVWEDNESDAKWYDYVVKSIKQDSTKYTLEVTATDQYINELSRNGFNLTLDPELNNNLGTVQEIAKNVLKDTDWLVPAVGASSVIFADGSSTTIEPSQFIADRSRETLVEATVTSLMDDDDSYWYVYKINDDAPDNPEDRVWIKSLTTIYLYYSDCNEQILKSPKGLEFISFKYWPSTSSEPITTPKEVDADGVITSKGVHFLARRSPQGALTLQPNEKYGIQVPQWVKNDSVKIVSEFRGAKFNYKPKIVFNSALGQYLTLYTSNKLSDKRAFFKVTHSFKAVNSDTGLVETISPTGDDYGGITLLDNFEYNDRYEGYIPKDNKFIFTYDSKTYYVPFEVQRGDLDGDGKTTSTDARLMLQLAVGKIDLNKFQYIDNYQSLSTSSTDYSAAITSTDARLALQLAVGKLKEANYSVPSDYVMHSTDSSGNPSTYHRFEKYNGKYYVPGCLEIHNLSAKLNLPTIRSQYYEYDDVKYEAPIFIMDQAVNGKDIQSTSGWLAGYQSSSSVSVTLKPEVVARSTPNGNSMISDMITGHYNPETKYTSYLELQPVASGSTNANKALLCNTGFFSNRLTIERIINDEKWVVEGEGTFPSNTTFQIYTYNFDHEKATTNPFTLLTPLSNPVTIGSSEPTSFTSTITLQNCNYTVNSFKDQDPKIGLFFIFPDNCATKIQISKFRIYKKIPDGSEDGYYQPEGQPTDAKVTTTYQFYSAQQLLIKQDKDDIAPLYEYIDDFPDDFTAVYLCEKRRAITAKESNYFNIIQSLCEKFECWAKFNIFRDDKGAIKGKYVTFHNYAGHPQYAGFRYGVNLTSVQRTQDSKGIVTKLIVKQNSNEFGKNGFCTIARAISNETGETWIQNFDHYVDTGLLKRDELNTSLYGPDPVFSTSSISTLENFDTIGYYPRLKEINSKMYPLSEAWAADSLILAEADAQFTTYDAALDASNEALTTALNHFEARFGVPFESRASLWSGASASYTSDQFLTIPELRKYIEEVAEAQQAVNLNTIEKDRAEKNKVAYQKKVNEEFNQLESYRKTKNSLHQAFYSKYYRFIQEGTWNSEEYYDDEKYYLDALSTGINSSKPQISYSISVLELSQLNGYKDFTFKVGDKTYVEDPEFFGYDETGAPRREEVVLTELTYVFEDPSKNSIKVQNYRSQFQDLFKKVNATVQQVQFTTGKYDKASIFSEADDTQRAEMIQGALNAPDVILQNAGEQSVRLDKSGLTIADTRDTSKLLRAVAGGFLMSEDGGVSWNTAITAKGIDASAIKTGQLDTGLINIYAGDQATFRWDAYGLTAYAFSKDSNGIKVNERAGARFDKLGIYGFNIPEGITKPGSNVSLLGSNWAPNKVVEWEINSSTGQYGPKPDDENNHYIRTYSTFELTEEGLALKLGKQICKYYIDENGEYHNSENKPITTQNLVAVGAVNNLVYNSVSSNGTPYYNSLNPSEPFTEVFSISGLNNQDKTFSIFSNGLLRGDQLKIGLLGENRQQISLFDESISVDEIESGGFTMQYTGVVVPSGSLMGSTKLIRPLSRYSNWFEWVPSFPSRVTSEILSYEMYPVEVQGDNLVFGAKKSININPNAESYITRFFVNYNFEKKYCWVLKIIGNDPLDYSCTYRTLSQHGKAVCIPTLDETKFKELLTETKNPYTTPQGSLYLLYNEENLVTYNASIASDPDKTGLQGHGPLVNEKGEAITNIKIPKLFITEGSNNVKICINKYVTTSQYIAQAKPSTYQYYQFATPQFYNRKILLKGLNFKITDTDFSLGYNMNFQDLAGQSPGNYYLQGTKTGSGNCLYSWVPVT